ncbi:hypothetical protein [Kitasatospora azatica]|uniref:hypothetical protein n=1 Tax=Kitasatospora azatica TaxID=58347 RepID=UPI00068A6777|nr:hypothetical protein [Kitasatospora azatica]
MPPQKKAQGRQKDQGPHIFRARIGSVDRALLHSVIETHRLDVAGGLRREESGEVATDAYATEEVLQQLRRQGISVQVVENATETGRSRQAEVGKGNRFAKGAVPRGTGLPEDGDDVPER